MTETPESHVLTPYDPGVEEQLKAGRDFVEEYREAFRELEGNSSEDEAAVEKNRAGADVSNTAPHP